MISTVGVLQVVVRFFVDVLAAIVTRNEVMQANDGTSGAEATTE